MNDTLTDDRGQVGIGTLIVFIAMVLVAAIAAGVLINTAGFLQTQAQTTGEQSTAQVADNVQIVNQVGYTGYSDEFQNTNWNVSSGPADDQIQRIELTVQKSPGAEAIDLSEATVEYLADEAETLTHVDAAFNNDDIDAAETLNSSDDYFFATRQVRGDSADSVLINDDDRSAIVVPLGTYQDDGNTTDAEWVEGSSTVTQPGFLNQGDEVTFIVTTAQGSKAEVSLKSPDLINQEPAVRL